MVIWTLDSCGFDATNQNCQIDVGDNWTFVSFVRKCPSHSSISNDMTGFNQIWQENTRGKGNTIDELLRNAPAGVFDIDARTGERVFKSGIAVSWSWDGIFPNRILNITVTGITLTTVQRTAIQTKLDARFGVGKVLLV